MQVDVIIPAYNRTEWLRECLLSVLSQTYRRISLILIDDGSEPPLESQSILADLIADERVKLLVQTNAGVASARNLGLDTATGDCIMILDSDDILDPLAVETLLSGLLRTDAEVAVGDWTNFCNSRCERIRVSHRAEYSDAYANCVKHGWVPGSFMLRNNFHARYNESMPWESMEFLLDYLAPGRNAVYLSSLTVNMRQHSQRERLTIKYDHFEPFMMGRFFAKKKRQLACTGLLLAERASALDLRILSSIHSLLRTHRFREAEFLFSEISWDRINEYDHFRFGSFAWFSRRFGFRIGAKGFMALNRVIGRA